MTTNTETNHAYDNARGWAGSIAELVAALDCDYDRLEELRDMADELRTGYTAYRCDNGTFDMMDENGQTAYENLGNGADEASAWAALFAAIHPDEAEELRELTEAATLEGDFPSDLHNACENVRERIQECPLSVEVRSGWCSPGSEEYAKPEEFNILLSTGGPALRIRGELDEHLQPCRAWLEYQDWGTPWTEYHSDGLEHDTLLTYCQQFYFGD
jgi:hypothetical protein